MEKTYNLSCPIELKESEDKKKPSRCHLNAYTGEAVELAFEDNPVVFDLDGIHPRSQTIPLLYRHDWYAGVGHTTKIAVENGVLVAEGVISRDTDYAKDVSESGKAGFPWQASICVRALQSDFLGENQTGIANGRTFTGPLEIVRESELVEISFCEYGADGNTSATVQAMEKRMNEKEKEMSQPVKPAQEPEKIASREESLDGSKDMVTETRKAMAAEYKRLSEIQKLAGDSHGELAAKAVEEGWTPERFELETLRAERPKAPAVQSVNRSYDNDVLACAALSANGRTGFIEKQFSEKTLEAAERFRGIGLQEFFELASGEPNIPRYKRDPESFMRCAFSASTSSLPGILSNVANKQLIAGFTYVDDAWRKISRIGTVSDFKTHTRYQLIAGTGFQKLTEGGEFKHATIGERSFTQQADTQGIMFAITRKMIIDDDMGALLQIPFSIGMSAGEAVSDAVWDLFLSNPTQADGKAFFHADHGNLSSGATTALSVTALTNAEIKFSEKKRPKLDSEKKARPLGIRPSIVLVPIALQTTAEMLMKSMTLNESATAGSPATAANPHVGKYEVVSTPYLSDTGTTGASSKAWYLLADPNVLPTMEVAFMNGRDTPTVQRAEANFDTLGVQFRGWIDFGVKEQDYLGGLKITGEQ